MPPQYDGQVPGAFPGADAPQEEPLRRFSQPGEPLPTLSRAVKTRKSEYIRPRKLRVRVGTWNVAAIAGTELELGEWFAAGASGGKDGEEGKTASDSGLEDVTNKPEKERTAQPEDDEEGDTQKVDLYVLGLQEVVDINSPAEALRPYIDPAPTNRWKEAIQRALPEYTFISSQQLVGLLLVVYASPSLAPLVTSVSSCSVGTGLMGYMGNKGAVCTRIVVGGTTRIALVNCHLSAGNDNASLQRRNWDAGQIVSRTRFDPVREEDEAADEDEGVEVNGDRTVRLGNEDFAFWFGDFNYRVEDIPGADMRRLLHLHAQGKYRQAGEPPSQSVEDPDDAASADSSNLPTPEDFEETEDNDPESDHEETDLDPYSDPASLATTLQSLLPHDQLHKQQRLRKAFHQGWHEGDITFLPTYKYDIGQPGVFDSSEKQRAPSWCDRILYRSKADWDEYEKKRLEEEEKVKRDEELKRLGLEAEKNKNQGEGQGEEQEGGQRDSQEGRKETGDDKDDTTTDKDPATEEQERNAGERASAFGVQPTSESSNGASKYDYDEYDEAEDDMFDTEPPTDEALQLLDYRSYQEISSSDHKPLTADFILSIDAVVPTLKAQIQQEVARQLDKAENEARPAVTVVVDSAPPEPEEGEAAAEGQQRSHDDESILRFGKIYYKTPRKRAFTIANTGGTDAEFSFMNPTSKHGKDPESPAWLKIVPDSEAQQIGDSPAIYTLPPGMAVQINITIEIDDIEMVRALNMSKESFPPIEHVIVLSVKDGRDYFISVAGNWVRTSFGLSLEELTLAPEQGTRHLDPKTLNGSPQQGGSAPRQLLELTEEISRLTERAVAEWEMIGEGQIPPWAGDDLGWPLNRKTWTFWGSERDQLLRSVVIDAMDVNQPFSNVFSPDVKSHHRVEILAETLLLFLHNLENGLISKSQWKELEAQSILNDKLKGKQQLTPREQQSQVLEVLSSSPVHSVSFTFVTFMLTRILHETAPIPSVSSFSAAAQGRSKSVSAESTNGPTPLQKSPTGRIGSLPRIPSIALPSGGPSFPFRFGRKNTVTNNNNNNNNNNSQNQGQEQSQSQDANQEGESNSGKTSRTASIAESSGSNASATQMLVVAQNRRVAVQKALTSAVARVIISRRIVPPGKEGDKERGRWEGHR
ncbi:hypothetical protein KEM55_000685 [Ascosphaera atra]|nr:hypothetical protein KEM55_000685 [Ascosphaera atra]